MMRENRVDPTGFLQRASKNLQQRKRSKLEKKVFGEDEERRSENEIQCKCYYKMSDKVELDHAYRIQGQKMKLGVASTLQQ